MPIKKAPNWPRLKFVYFPLSITHTCLNYNKHHDRTFLTQFSSMKHETTKQSIIFYNILFFKQQIAGANVKVDGEISGRRHLMRTLPTGLFTSWLTCTFNFNKVLSYEIFRRSFLINCKTYMVYIWY